MGWDQSTVKAELPRGRRRPSLESSRNPPVALDHVSTAIQPRSRPPDPVLNSDGSTNYDQIIQARRPASIDSSTSTEPARNRGRDRHRHRTTTTRRFGGGVGLGDQQGGWPGSTSRAAPTASCRPGSTGRERPESMASTNGGGSTGVAPGADIVALRVFGDNNQGSASVRDRLRPSTGSSSQPRPVQHHRGQPLGLRRRELRLEPSSPPIRRSGPARSPTAISQGARRVEYPGRDRRRRQQLRREVPGHSAFPAIVPGARSA